jgi:hypothetical protein
VQKLCHHFCEPANHPPRFALSLHGFGGHLVWR